MIPFDSLVLRGLASGLVLLFLVVSVGCEDRQPTETAMFESAEVDFRHGNYEDAMEGYQAFLEQYPTSPLAPTVEMRLRNIHREVSSVMEDTGTPTPTYHGSDRQQREAGPDSDVAEPPPNFDADD